jgi:hypothetical protein
VWTKHNEQMDRLEAEVREVKELLRVQRKPRSAGRRK